MIGGGRQVGKHVLWEARAPVTRSVSFGVSERIRRWGFHASGAFPVPARGALFSASILKNS